MERHRTFGPTGFFIILLFYNLLYCRGNSTLLPFNVLENRPAPLQDSDLNNLNVKESSANASELSEKAENLTVNDIFISVRTTIHFQYSRLPIILKTWFQLAKENIWFLTDTDKRMHQRLADGHMINTNCPTSHNVSDLCCKTNVGYDRFLQSDKKWWCRFDDDNYVNIPRLVDILQKYDYEKDWYLGKRHLGHAKKPGVEEPYEIFYATGGAGYCISKSLALKMIPFASGGKFKSNCVDLDLPEDIAMGYLLEQKVNVAVTSVLEFHSHLENLSMIKSETFKDQISFGFSKIHCDWNVLVLPGFHGRYDPTRILSLHCFLFPHFRFCPR